MSATPLAFEPVGANHVRVGSIDVRVANTGTLASGWMQIKIQVPAFVRPDGGRCGAGQGDPAVVFCSMGTFEPGQTKTANEPVGPAARSPAMVSWMVGTPTAARRPTRCCHANVALRPALPTPRAG